MNLTSKTIDSFCALIDLERNKPVIDLSNVNFIDTFALVYLGLYIRFHNSKGKSFWWHAPQDEKVRNYLARQRFYQHFNFEPSFVETESLKCTPSTTCWNDIKEIENVPWVAEDIAEEVKSLLVDNHVNAAISEIYETTAEIVENFAEHSMEKQAVITVQWFPRIKWLALAIGDCGIGVKRSLLQNRKHSHLANKADKIAIVEAFKPSVSRKLEGGTGLTTIEQTVVELNGNLFFASNSGYFRVQGGKRFTGEMNFNFPGVQMEISFPTRGDI